MNKSKKYYVGIDDDTSQIFIEKSDGRTEVNLSRYPFFNIFIDEKDDISIQNKIIAELQKKENSEIVNLVFHYIRELDNYSGIIIEDIYKIHYIFQIQQGFYGEDFKNDFIKLNADDMDIILYYIYKKEKNRNVCDYFKPVINQLFNNTVFYYDSFAEKLHICTTDSESFENSLKYRICSDMFKSIFLDAEIHYNCCPIIIGSKRGVKLSGKYANII